MIMYQVSLVPLIRNTSATLAFWLSLEHVKLFCLRACAHVHSFITLDHFPHWIQVFTHIPPSHWSPL